MIWGTQCPRPQEVIGAPTYASDGLQPTAQLIGWTVLRAPSTSPEDIWTLLEPTPVRS